MADRMIKCPTCSGKGYRVVRDYCELANGKWPCRMCHGEKTIPDRRKDDRVPCPHCTDGVYNVDEPTVVGGVGERRCHACRGTGWSDRRRPTANDRSVARIIAWAEGVVASFPAADMTEFQQGIEVAVDAVQIIIREEAERDQTD